MEDLVGFLLETLSVHWDDATYDPMPTLVDDRDATPYTQSTVADATVDGSMVGLTEQDRSYPFDLADGNVLLVGTSISRDDQALDLYFNIKVDAAIGIRIEGVHESDRGHVADAADFLALVEAAKDAIWAERQWPLAGYYMLDIGDEHDRSVTEKDYFRYDFRVGFSGYKDLP